MSVDPDKADQMLDPEGTRYSRLEKRDQTDRSKKLRTRYRVAKDMRASPRQTTRAVGDSTDMTGSGANSVVNGPYK